MQSDELTQTHIIHNKITFRIQQYTVIIITRENFYIPTITWSAAVSNYGWLKNSFSTSIHILPVQM